MSKVLTWFIRLWITLNPVQSGSHTGLTPQQQLSIGIRLQILVGFFF